MKTSKERLLLKKVRLALTPRSSLLRTHLENGAVVSGYNRDGYGGRGVYLFGDSIEPELASIQRFLHPGCVFVDIGANVGVYTMKAAKEVGPEGLVIAIEPFIESAHQLSVNVRQNGYANVRVRNFCISRTTQETKLYLNKGKPNSFGLRKLGTAQSTSVLSISLNDLCRWENLTRLDYLKIDAEGSEADILEGGMETISRFRPIVQLEVTKQSSRLALNYRRFSAPDSPNNILIPAENLRAIDTVTSLGWIETEGASAA